MKTSKSGPHLFFSAADLPRLRKNFNEDARFAEMKESLLKFDRAAERKFLREEVNIEDKVQSLRRVCDVMQDMAFLSLMTGDEDAAQLAVESVRTLMRFQIWDFFMEGDRVIGVQGSPLCAIAVATVIDWVGDVVDFAERQTWLQAIAQRGCEPCYLGLHNIRYPRETKGWSINPKSVQYIQRSVFPHDSARRPEITQTTNLRAAPAGGLAIGAAAIAIYGDQSQDDLDRWQEMALFSLRAFESIYLPDGCYGEGVNYGNYTSESIFMGVVALARIGAADLRKGINWSGHVQFMLNMAMPTSSNPYEVVNIGDSGRHRGQVVFQHPNGRPECRSALPFWTAREFRDGSAQWFGEKLAARHNIWAVIFFDESVEAVPPVNEPQTWYSDLDWVVARTGYRVDDFLVSLRSGIGWNHEHADRNSIIIKGYGEQLIVDPSRPPYPFTDPCWMMRTTAGHSAILIDGEGHLYNNGVEGTNSTIAQARLVGKGEGEGYSYWISDATQAYRVANLEIKSVVRAMIVFYDLRTVVVVDSVSKWKQSSKIEARFFADNWDGDCEVTTDDKGFEIRRPGAFAHAQTFCRSKAEISQGLLPIPEERAVKHPFVSVETEPTMATTLVTVIALGPTGGEAASVAIDAADDEIKVALKATGASATCRINDTGLVPEIKVI